MSNKDKVIVALGADIKSRFLVAENNRLYLGPDLGDLGIAENYQLLKKELLKATRNLGINIVAYDLHPGYFSSHLAKEYSKELPAIHQLPVQHHHAHIASVMFEHNFKKSVIGVSFDGTGYGTDKNIWGGEFLRVDGESFKRLAHLKYIMMPGGDKVISQPWRMALSILREKGIPFLKNVKKRDVEIVLSMMSKRINSPLTSSAGRLFDAAAALLGICTHALYEAEGPIKLEKLCRERIEDAYDFKVIKDETSYIIDTEPIFLGMTKDIKRKKSNEYIATKFHNSIVEVITNTVKILSSNIKIKEIALSGGVFANNFLRNKVMQRLESSGYSVYTNEKVPVNDYNISLGQYYVSCSTRKN